ncbi:MAG: serine/threonine protein kinase [Deltaproteobacteria bacterium]|nr:serine/threonine protein kinase [Deltaproteobacteria bacterium]
MRVRLDRYEAANRSVQTRSVLGFVFGGVGLVFFGFLTFLGILMIAMPDSEGNALWARRAGIFLGFFLGVVPTALSALLIAWGVKKRTRFRRLGELAAVARNTPVLTTPILAHALRLTPAEAEGLVLEASALGLIEEGPSPVATTAPSRPPPAMPAMPAMPATPAGKGHTAPTMAPLGRGAAPSNGEGGRPESARPASSIGFGTVLGSYRVEEPLGRGGMGAVFAARHLRTGRRYAVKTILAGPNASEAAIRRFEREATAASALGHPGIVQVHDFDQAEGGHFYLVMDLLEGEPLDKRIERAGPLAWPEAQRIALELCDALAAAHDHHLLHRDIKPGNIFLARASGVSASSAPSSRPKERAVLVDFGLVKPIAESGSLLTSEGAVVGTPMYMSPEQARGEPLDVRSDTYSLAAVIFEMTTGAPPFLDRSIASVYARLLGEPPPLASKVSRASEPLPRALDGVLSRALAKDRDARYATARELGAALAAITDEGDVVHSPATERL